MGKDRPSVLTANKKVKFKKGATKWPGGKASEKFKEEVYILSEFLTRCRVLAIDPASGGSSNPGWALFDEGEYVASGEFDIKSKKNPIQMRLVELQCLIVETFGSDLPEVLVIERIRGSHAHHYLFWSIGASIAAAEIEHLLECPVGFWKVVTPTDYEKTDETDAIYIGAAVIKLAQELIEEEEN